MNDFLAEEIDLDLKSVKSGKAAGPDGIHHKPRVQRHTQVSKTDHYSQ